MGRLMSPDQSESGAIKDCTRLFKESFSIKSTPENKVMKKSKSNLSAKKVKSFLRGIVQPGRRFGSPDPSTTADVFDPMSRYDSGYEGTDDQDSRGSCSSNSSNGFVNSPKSSTFKQKPRATLTKSFGSSKTDGGIHDVSFTEQFVDGVDEDDIDDIATEPKTPQNFNNLIAGEFTTSPANSQPILRSKLDLNFNDLNCCSPTTDRDVDSNNSNSSSSSSSKRRFNSPDSRLSPPRIKRSCRARSPSPSSPAIRLAVQRSTTDDDLIGDFSKTCVLPLVEGSHSDLKYIHSSTLSELINGGFADKVASLRIVDCRYPYEYEGGHIVGAVNLFTKESIEQIMIDPLNDDRPSIGRDDETEKRAVVVFHCEFSQERGPGLLRFLRSIDRQRNNAYYPALHYPEIYLLHGGYENFFKEQPDLCVPRSYKSMTDSAHETDLKKFRVKSKTWQGEKVSRMSENGGRSRLKRLDF